MAKQDYTLKFTKAYVDVESDTITEIGKETNTEYSLSETLQAFEGRQFDITFKETNELVPSEQE